MPRTNRPFANARSPVDCTEIAHADSGNPQRIEIGPASIRSSASDMHVTIDGRVFSAGDKYTILETGWAVYFTADALPRQWLARWGETRQKDGDCNEIASAESTLVTSHPVLVALALRCWWHGNGRPIPTAPLVSIPSFAEAVAEVRAREILNDFNVKYACTVPGLRRWAPDGTMY